MEQPIRLEASEDTPQVILDRQNNEFMIKGRSLPEDAPKFYTPILEWLQEYVKDPNSETIFKMELDYYNSASVKELIRLLLTLEDIKKTSNSVKIIWYHKKKDKLMKSRGKEIKSLVDLPFEIKARS